MALKETWDESQEWFLQLFSVKPVGVLYYKVSYIFWYRNIPPEKVAKEDPYELINTEEELI